jgi:hypothetical protein
MAPLTIYPKTKEEEKVYLQLAKVLKSQINRETKAPYNPEFVKKILEGQKEIREGKGVKIKVGDLWK